MSDVNEHLVLISGKSSTGKSASLMGLRNPEGVLYLNCESNKRLPFPAKFMKAPDGRVGFTITDPYQVYEAFTFAETKPEIHTIVIDTLTYLMDMFESIYVLGSSNTQKAWGDFSQYFKKLMQQYVAKSSKSVIFLAHTADSINESEMSRETAVPIKGSLKGNGIESYFSVILSTKKVPLKVLKDYKSPLLNITPKEEALGFKYVFQTDLTRDTVHERIRGPMGMWDTQETFIDNNCQAVLDRLDQYYGIRKTA